MNFEIELTIRNYDDLQEFITALAHLVDLIPEWEPEKDEVVERTVDAARRMIVVNQT